MMLASGCRESSTGERSMDSSPGLPAPPQTPAGSAGATKDSLPASTAPESREDPRILAIRAEYQRINAASLAKKTHAFECETDVTVTYFTEKASVVKIVIDWGYIGDGTSRYEYYYRDGRFIFGLASHTGGPANGPETTNEFRTYVDKDSTIRYLEGSRQEPCTTCRFDGNSLEYRLLRAKTDAAVKAAVCD
jgi:hypothetical protein